MDLTLKTKCGYFNQRVAAVIIHNNKLLFQKNTAQPMYYLVGGRVKFGESSEEALVREIKEELNIVIKDYTPIWINECFFEDEGINFHEIGMYYLVDIDNTFFNKFDAVFSTKEAHRTNTYQWLDIDKIDDAPVYPAFIKKEIKKVNDNLKLIITRD